MKNDYLAESVTEVAEPAEVLDSHFLKEFGVFFPEHFDSFDYGFSSLFQRLAAKI